MTHVSSNLPASAPQAHSVSTSQSRKEKEDLVRRELMNNLIRYAQEDYKSQQSKKDSQRFCPVAKQSNSGVFSAPIAMNNSVSPDGINDVPNQQSPGYNPMTDNQSGQAILDNLILIMSNFLKSLRDIQLKYSAAQQANSYTIALSSYNAKNKSADTLESAQSASAVGGLAGGVVGILGGVAGVAGGAKGLAGVGEACSALGSAGNSFVSGTGSLIAAPDQAASTKQQADSELVGNVGNNYDQSAARLLEKGASSSQALIQMTNDLVQSSNQLLAAVDFSRM